MNATTLTQPLMFAFISSLDKIVKLLCSYGRVIFFFFPQSEWHGMVFHDGARGSNGGSTGAADWGLHSLAPRSDLWRSADPLWGGCNIPPRNTWLQPS